MTLEDTSLELNVYEPKIEMVYANNGYNPLQYQTAPFVSQPYLS